MAMIEALTLIAGEDLPEDVREVLRPGEVVEDANGRARVLPTWFYQVDSWDTAKATVLAPYVALWELIQVDVREHEAARTFPRYVPCAISVLAAHLSAFRQSVGTYVHISANGGYRSPGHGRNSSGSTHAWGTAADVYRVGGDYLEDQDTISKYLNHARAALPAARCEPAEVSEMDDHLHIDIGYLVVEP